MISVKYQWFFVFINRFSHQNKELEDARRDISERFDEGKREKEEMIEKLEEKLRGVCRELDGTRERMAQMEDDNR